MKGLRRASRSTYWSGVIGMSDFELIMIYAFAFNIQKLYAKDRNQGRGVILHQLKGAS